MFEFPSNTQPQLSDYVNLNCFTLYSPCNYWEALDPWIFVDDQLDLSFLYKSPSLKLALRVSGSCLTPANEPSLITWHLQPTWDDKPVIMSEPTPDVLSSNWLWHRSQFFDHCSCRDSNVKNFIFPGSHVWKISWNLMDGLDIESRKSPRIRKRSDLVPKFPIEVLDLIHDPHPHCRDRRHKKRLRVQVDCGNTSLFYWVSPVPTLLYLSRRARIFTVRSLSQSKGPRGRLECFLGNEGIQLKTLERV
jgi:hypothetical protein